MNLQNKKDQLHKSQLLAIQASYQALTESFSLDELSQNKKLRDEIRKIKRQLQLIEELNQSFEF